MAYVLSTYLPCPFFFSDEKKEFTVQFRQAADYPLDLYYLMDLTVSMIEDKVMLESLGTYTL